MNDLQQTIYDVSRVLLWPVLVAAHRLPGLGAHRVRLPALRAVAALPLPRPRRARGAHAAGAQGVRRRQAAHAPTATCRRTTTPSSWSRFLFDLIRNYQTRAPRSQAAQAAAGVRVLHDQAARAHAHPRAPRPHARPHGHPDPARRRRSSASPKATSPTLADNLTTAFSVTVIGLLIGGLAFVISIVRDRMYSQDISDMEYLLELLEGDDGRLHAGRRRRTSEGRWDEAAGRRVRGDRRREQACGRSSRSGSAT